MTHVGRADMCLKEHDELITLGAYTPSLLGAYFTGGLYTEITAETKYTINRG